jgi:hypothetical protein
MSDPMADLTDDDVRAYVGALVGALTVGGIHPLNETQQEIVDAVVHGVFGRTYHWNDVTLLTPAETHDAVTDSLMRTRLVQMMVALELVLHPLPEDVEHSVSHYSRALEVNEPMVEAARRYANGQMGLMYADIQRNSWYTEETKREAMHGRLWELMRSKVAYSGVVPDEHIEKKWAALGDLPENTWGRAVFDFYGAHGFPLPGSRHGIGEVSARHDWVHVLAGYPPTPEGEIDVFTFIAAAMDDPRGFTLLVTTLALFQNYSIRHVALKRIAIARPDTLADPGAPERFADAMHRGLCCTTDPMQIDQFDYAARDLEELRKEWEIPVKADDGPQDNQYDPEEHPLKESHHI